MALSYKIHLAADDNGMLLVTCSDLPEVTSFGATADDAIARARDAIEEAIAARIADREEIPLASAPRKGVPRVGLPALTATKVELYRAMRTENVSKADMGRRLNVHMPQVDRLLDVHFASRLDQLKTALAAFGKVLTVEVHDAEDVKAPSGQKRAAPKLAHALSKNRRP